MVTSIESKVFSSKAVNDVLNNKNTLEAFELRDYLGKNYKGLLSRALVDIDEINCLRETYCGLIEWWLHTLATNPTAWRDGYLRVTPATDKELERYLDAVCAEYTRR